MANRSMNTAFQSKGSDASDHRTGPRTHREGSDLLRRVGPDLPDGTDRKPTGPDRLTTLGGQHRSPPGITTMDGETPLEAIERRRRAYCELGEYCYRAESAPPLDPSDEWYRDFEAARAECANESDVAF